MSRQAILKVVEGTIFDISKPYVEMKYKSEEDVFDADNNEIVDQEKFTPVLFNLADKALRLYEAGEVERALVRVQNVVGRFGMRAVKIHDAKAADHVINSISENKVRSYYFSRIGVFVEYEIDGVVYGLKNPSCNKGLRSV